MLFNSIEFAVFLPIVFAIYWLIGSHKIRLQNTWLLVSSYFFYGWWDWRFLTLIAFSTAVDFTVGLQLEKTNKTKTRKRLLLISLLSNLGLLGFFKYYNFFVDNFVEAFTIFGQNFQPIHLHIVLPVGISFYTFQTLSYTIDVYRKKIKPTQDWIAFSAFVSFFPQLVAGPIERAGNLLPQFQRARKFDVNEAKDGLRQMLWGLFKKIVIADTSAVYVNEIFGSYQDFSSPALWLGAFYFAFQIYGDFSGYSDIAIGTAKLFGFHLMRNFNFPYFARDIADFWRRWHISLSTWFKDYVYIPLGGSRVPRGKALRNVFIVFLVSGFWHGANWTFIAWGALHALLFAPLMLLNINRKHLASSMTENRILPQWNELWQMGTTFFQVLIAWVFFRAASVSEAWHYLHNMFIPHSGESGTTRLKYLPLIALLIAWEWIFRKEEHGLSIRHWPMPLRWVSYFAFLWLIFYFMGAEQEFIYFQF